MMASSGAKSQCDTNSDLLENDYIICLECDICLPLGSKPLKGWSRKEADVGSVVFVVPVGKGTLIQHQLCHDAQVAMLLGTPTSALALDEVGADARQLLWR